VTMAVTKEREASLELQPRSGSTDRRYISALDLA
jgi:hypothetical protein